MMNQDFPRHPGTFAAKTPDKPAVILGISGQSLSYAQLEAKSNQVAHLLRKAGCNTGDHIALMMENSAWFVIIAWAAQRAGLYLTAINWHLQASESAYVIENSGAKVLITSDHIGTLAQDVKRLSPDLSAYHSVGTISGFDALEDAIKSMPTTAISDESEGKPMLYSSGTTGKPKGIKRLVQGEAFGTMSPRDKLNEVHYGFGPETVFMCAGPLYHSSPLNFAMGTHRYGATLVVMEKFDGLAALDAIERYRVTSGIFVPTHFARMLKVPAEARKNHDVSSMRHAIHVGAPCSKEIKEAMIAWWGNVIHELYGGTEGVGYCMITPEEWLQKKGSVGKSVMGPLHILDVETGEELPPGETGMVYFENAATFEYHNEPEKTREVFNDKGWATLGDIGYVDEDGYLYLTDRKSQMIISGGVNIYPQEVENCLAEHPDVEDVAVIGVPNSDFGEEVKAVILLKDGAVSSAEKSQELIAFTRQNIAHYKCPRSIDFVTELPRLPNGKLLKRALRDRYWP